MKIILVTLRLCWHFFAHAFLGHIRVELKVVLGKVADKDSVKSSTGQNC